MRRCLILIAMAIGFFASGGWLVAVNDSEHRYGRHGFELKIGWRQFRTLEVTHWNQAGSCRVMEHTLWEWNRYT